MEDKIAHIESDLANLLKNFTEESHNTKPTEDYAYNFDIVDEKTELDDYDVILQTLNQIGNEHGFSEDLVKESALQAYKFVRMKDFGKEIIINNKDDNEI